MATLEQWKKAKANLKLTNQAIAENANLPLRTVEQVMCGKVKNPRNDTVQAIERALGLAPAFTDEERAIGAGIAPTVLSDADLRTLTIMNRAEEILGSDYVNAILNMIELSTELKEKEKK